MKVLAEKTRERLLDAAGRTFAERGYRAATVREICRRARVNVAAVNYYFGDKERLYIESVKQAHRLRVGVFPLRDWPSDTPPEEKLRGFIRVTIQRMLSDDGPAWHMQLMMRELAQPTAAVREVVHEFIQPHFAVVMGILGEMLPAEVTEQRRRMMAFSIIGQCLFYRIAQPIVSSLLDEDSLASLYDLQALEAHIAGFTLAALDAPRDKRSRKAKS